jgi:tetratricopeptide (TPR) repeat protein
VRAVVPLHNGGVLAGSHDGNVYHLSSSGELLEKFEAEGEVTCVATSKQMDLAVAGFGNRIKGFRMNPMAKPIAIRDSFEKGPIEKTPLQNENRGSVKEYEPMFGVGMFDEPIPDTTGILSSGSESVSPTTNSHYNENNHRTEGGEFREFASKVKKGDVKNYLRLGNAAWVEKRLERAEEHYKRATEVDPEEPRAWHNLAICNYHLALKRNPDNLEGAVKSAYGPLKIAKEKGGFNYKSADETLAYLASQLGLIEEDSD